MPIVRINLGRKAGIKNPSPPPATPADLRAWAAREAERIRALLCHLADLWELLEADGWEASWAGAALSLTHPEVRSNDEGIERLSWIGLSPEDLG